MRLVNPTVGRHEGSTQRIRERSSNWARDPMCVFSNAKPNANELLEEIRTRLSASWGRQDIGFEAKHSPAAPADPNLLDWLAEQYRCVLLAVGD